MILINKKTNEKNLKRKEENMLKRFEVTNYRNFKDKFVFDLSKPNNYEFNKNLIKKGLVNKAIIFGKNGTGKSNLGTAIFDITWHLTDKQKQAISAEYLNGDCEMKYANFCYVFQFGKDEVKYEYFKTNEITLGGERLFVNGDMIISYVFNDKKATFIQDEEIKNLLSRVENLRPEQSLVKYIYMNASLDKDSPIRKLVDFVDRMLWFRSVQNNQFLGYKESPDFLSNILFNKEKTKDFENFLRDIDKENLDYDLSIKDAINGNKMIIANFLKRSYQFESVASTGTRSLLLFFCWALEFGNISFLYLDEFDAYYHYETSEFIMKLVNEYDNFQAVLTTHNTSLMNNELTRPDCCYIIENKQIHTLAELAGRELRIAHNLERIYKNGGFPTN